MVASNSARDKALPIGGNRCKLWIYKEGFNSVGTYRLSLSLSLSLSLPPSLLVLVDNIAFSCTCIKGQSDHTLIGSSRTMWKLA